ncbi:hypothetical protein [uncultured Maribacter sp.]|uniref:hypothetical protein n=1 Tax=uncultured Maribacter sp. TaxID=431308 RepID=UPI0026224D72|nr:hypothetical protein [uncultured Maribacter sp.]
MGIFNNFLKKNKSIPEFEFIKSYEFKDKYFSRVKKWTWIKQDQISLMEKDENGQVKMTTMEYWFQEMFLDADGQKTIEEYLNVLIEQFQKSKMDIPTDLDVFMTETLWSLKTDLNAIEFTDNQVELEPEFKNPIDGK